MRDSTVKLDGRVLYLTEDPEAELKATAVRR